MKLKQGDVVNFTQEDGKVLTLIVGTYGIVVKAELPGTDLKITKDSNFAVYARAIEKQ